MRLGMLLVDIDRVPLHIKHASAHIGTSTRLCHMAADDSENMAE